MAANLSVNVAREAWNRFKVQTKKKIDRQIRQGIARVICDFITELGFFETLKQKRLKANKLFVWGGGGASQSLQINNLLNSLTLSKHGLTDSTGMRRRSRMTSCEYESFITDERK